MLKRLLESAGYQVLTASSAAGALARMEAASATQEPYPQASNAFDVIVSDLGLPDATGQELIRRIRARWSTPAVAVSGFGSESDVQSSREAGFAEHLTKPIQFDQLKAAIARVAFDVVHSSSPASLDEERGR